METYSNRLKQLEDEVSSLKLSEAQKKAAISIASLVITENLELDKEETERRREAAANSVPEIEYKKNQIIVRKGEIVSASQLEMLKQLGILEGTNPLSPSYTIGVVLLMLILYIVVTLHFSKQKKKMPESQGNCNS